ncbi:hypothetical protein QTP88_014193 [Uroleucon formosanum]
MDIGLLILSEHNRSPCNHPSWASSSDGRCSIALTTIAGIVAEESGSGPGFAWLRFGNVRAFSCYWTPNGDSAADRLEAFNGFLDGLDQVIRQGEKENETLLVSGDFNAKSTNWGSSVDDSKGEALESFAASLGLWTNNVGSHPTFQRGASSSVIDLTFSGPGPYEVVDWEVLDDYSGSDHNYITFNLIPYSRTLNDLHLGWATRKLDHAAFSRKLDEGPPVLEEPASVDDAAEWLRDMVLMANTAERIAFRETRKALRVSIRKSQKLGWAALCASVDNDPRGVPYRIVSGRLGRQPPGLAAIGREIEIADHLFPTMPIINWQRVPMDSQVDPNFPTTATKGYNLNHGNECPPITTEEVRLTVSRLSRGKATGLDGIPNEMLSLIANRSPDIFVRMYSRCLSESVFPARWKRARLLLLHKGPNKPVSNPSSFRPLCMLDTTGKLFERILLLRLNDHLERAGGLSTNQFGFRRGCSTEDAINKSERLQTPWRRWSTPHDAIDGWMGAHGLQLARHKTEAIMLTKKWAYRDPVFVVGGHTVPLLRKLRYLGLHLDSHLSFSGHFTTVSGKASQAALAIGRLMPDLGGPSQSKRTLLMSVVNSRLLYACPTWAERACKYAICRNLMIRAQRTAALRVTRAYRTVSAEAASFLAGNPPGDLLALERKRVRSKLDDPDRADSKDEIRRAERDILLAAWSNRWSRGVRGAWTRTILPDLIRWMKRCPKDLTFHVTQALTGHGCFRYYLHRMKRASDAACLYCQHPEDTAEHTIFDCVHWDPLRLPVKMFVGNRNITPGDVQDLLCGPSDVPFFENDRLRAASQRATQSFYDMVDNILSCKEHDERIAEAERRANAVAAAPTD